LPWPRRATPRPGPRGGKSGMDPCLRTRFVAEWETLRSPGGALAAELPEAREHGAGAGEKDDLGDSSEEGGPMNIIGDFLAGLVGTGLALGGLVVVLLALMWVLGGPADSAKWGSPPPPYSGRPLVRPRTARNEYTKDGFGSLLGVVITVGMMILILMPLVPGPDPGRSPAAPPGRAYLPPGYWAGRQRVEWELRTLPSQRPRGPQRIR
jgi:hypothetical protein